MKVSELDVLVDFGEEFDPKTLIKSLDGQISANLGINEDQTNVSLRPDGINKDLLKKEKRING